MEFLIATLAVAFGYLVGRDLSRYRDGGILGGWYRRGYHQAIVDMAEVAKDEVVEEIRNQARLN
jgi:hypothetical protein